MVVKPQSHEPGVLNILLAVNCQLKMMDLHHQMYFLRLGDLKTQLTRIAVRLPGGGGVKSNVAFLEHSLHAMTPPHHASTLCCPWWPGSGGMGGGKFPDALTSLVTCVPLCVLLYCAAMLEQSCCEDVAQSHAPKPVPPQTTLAHTSL